MTQIEYAKKGLTTPEIDEVARIENLERSFILEGVRNGTIVIPKNRRREIKKPCGIGKGLRTKINANIGTSAERPNIAIEMKKLKVAVDAGADTIMDLTVGAGIRMMLEHVIKESSVPVGTVPIYEVASRALKTGGIADMEWSTIEPVLTNQAEMGVDFFTIHAGITKEIVEYLARRERILDVVSRGGSLIVDWIVKTGDENPLYTHFDRILKICRAYDVGISLGDGMRPGSLKDAGDEAQISELMVLGTLASRARDFGVQVMIEGPGHVPLNEIAYNVELQKKLCHGAPFYVLGPLVTDVAPGYDHIVSAIGGAVAAWHGADFLCYVTPSEHLRLPSIDDIKEGVVASRIAAHAADIAKGVKGAMEWDISMSRARGARDWESQFKLALDPERPKLYRRDSRPASEDVCSMCNDFCPIKRSEESLKR